MSYNWAGWEAATRNAGSARPGAQALMRWALAQYPGLSRNLGIYNYRPVRGSTSLSIHAEGRALDVGFPVVNGRAHVAGSELVKILGAKGKALGIQAIIWDRMIYSARSPQGRAYTGVNPHVDHVHCELTRHAGETLTDARIVELVGGIPAGAYPRRTLRVQSPMMSGPDVLDVQNRLSLPQDGLYGQRTADGVRAFQKTAGLTVDGVVGPKTWVALGF